MSTAFFRINLQIFPQLPQSFFDFKSNSISVKLPLEIFQFWLFSIDT